MTVEHFVLLAGKIYDPKFQRCRKAAELLEQASGGNLHLEVMSMWSTDYEVFLQNLECGVVGPVKLVHKENVLFMFGPSKESRIYAGGSDIFLGWTKREFGYDDSRTNRALFNGVARRHFMASLQATGRQFFKMVFESQNPEDDAGPTEPLGEIIVEMFTDVCPKTCARVLDLVAGKMGGPTYAGSLIHRIVPGGWVQGGEIKQPEHVTDEDASTLESFPDETFAVKHNIPGIVGLASQGNVYTNASQFYITLEELPWLDGKRVAFGRVIEGMRVLRTMAKLETENQRPVMPCVVRSCSVIKFNK